MTTPQAPDLDRMREAADHDDLCPRQRFRFSWCTCGGETRTIVREIKEGFARQLKDAQRATR